MTALPWYTASLFSELFLGQSPNLHPMHHHRRFSGEYPTPHPMYHHRWFLGQSPN
eukprot:CAMPEP_0174369524 /NCGR_PEP_ID=MMETSP0811_2-20130205/92803_1 /TAXON_ID=73025 ORGANISM="Eutreptiella gymnastica-like, Strain CCMP1594" /NCGR_SAMPLE_ID=MMETSP0811_2 /ASSEMBLY_ACC=CAM_ASM_000667 /LENGTH=54 /DNA_ID=CAMNT_0015514055 /DNA_START=28 /DNA_END=189 /DNA_ORIENTATION=+